MTNPFADISTRELTAQAYRHTFVDQGQGTPVSLIHGSLCDWRYRRWQIPAFATQYRVLSPSLRSYCPGAPSYGQFSTAQHAQDLQGLLYQHIHDENVHIVVHSRGGHVALLLAQKLHHQ